ncbi:MAG TPA: prepilin-type N-terminal cleavage/methylation domain-containing protein, partial [Chthoniobacteraceae bacterium]
MNHKRAFTLVELMLALAVTGLLVVVLINIANTTSNAWLSGEAQAESYANARGSINLMAREIKGAVVDLDLGFAIGTLPEESNNFVLKFLTRTGPTEEQNTPVRKIAYQLGWADSGIIPEITTTYDNRHRTPVLVRTLSNNLDDVFQVKT